MTTAHTVATAHFCHWPGCSEQVPPKLWGCRRHWYALPKQIRNEIWRTFRPGQEIDKQPSAEYLVAARAAQEWIKANHAVVVREYDFDSFAVRTKVFYPVKETSMSGTKKWSYSFHTTSKTDAIAKVEAEAANCPATESVKAALNAIPFDSASIAVSCHGEMTEKQEEPASAEEAADPAKEQFHPSGEICLIIEMR